MSQHWTPQRKAAIVHAIMNGGDRNSILSEHGISAEEYDHWERSYTAGGLERLRMYQDGRGVAYAAPAPTTEPEYR